MPSELSSTDAIQTADDPKASVLQRIEFVCRRIVQGQSAIRLSQMRWYRVCTVLTVVLSVFGSAGLAKKQVDWIAKSEQGPITPLDWMIVGVALFGLLAAIVLELYRAFGIDKKALQAISAEASFSRLLMELENALESADPRPNLDQVVRDAKTLGTNFHDVLKEPDLTAVERLKDQLVNQFQKNWMFRPSERKGKAR